MSTDNGISNLRVTMEMEGATAFSGAELRWDNEGGGYKGKNADSGVVEENKIKKKGGLCLPWKRAIHRLS